MPTKYGASLDLGRYSFDGVVRIGVGQVGMIHQPHGSCPTGREAAQSNATAVQIVVGGMVFNILKRSGGILVRRLEAIGQIPGESIVNGSERDASIQEGLEDIAREEGVLVARAPPAAVDVHDDGPA